MTAKRATNRGPILHLDGQHKPLENSPAGVRMAADQGEGIDLDSLMTLATAAVEGAKALRTFANTHYPNLARDFVWTKRSERVAHDLGIKGVVAGRPAQARVNKIPWALVATAVSKDGRHPIKSIASQLALCAKEGVKHVEHEPKDTPSVEEFRKIFAAAERAFGPAWFEHYLVKRLVNLPGWKTCLKNAHTADPRVVTMAINIGAMDPKTLPAYVKEYRR